EAASAVRADVVEYALDAARAERALVRADARVCGVRRQVPVAELAVRSELEHSQNLAPCEASPIRSVSPSPCGGRRLRSPGARTARRDSHVRLPRHRTLRGAPE